MSPTPRPAPFPLPALGGGGRIRHLALLLPALFLVPWGASVGGTAPAAVEGAGASKHLLPPGEPAGALAGGVLSPSTPALGPEARLSISGAAPADPTTLGATLARLATAGSRSERWGIIVVSLDRGDTLWTHNADEAMAPASNMKLYTSAAALHLLGPEYRFTTWLVADGPVENGVLHGDLLLYGTGDPTLATRMPDRPTGGMERFVEAVREAGIREIRGQVVGDGSYFRGDPRRPSWNPADLDNWFAAPISALTFNENMVTLRVQPTRAAGLPPRVLTLPEGADVAIRNESRIRPGGPPLALFRDDPDGPIRITGTLRPRQVEAWRSMTHPDPPRYAASILRAALQEAGVRVQGGTASLDARNGVPSTSRISGRTLVAPAFGSGERLRTLAVHHSPPVSELIHPVNKRSHNLYAEALLLAMARAEGETPDFEGGARTLARFLVEEVGVDPESLHVEDGSGLSRLNRTTPRDLVRLLAWMEGSPHLESYHASLPEAGNRQELGRMDRTPAAGNLRAKTGTIHRVSALSGTVRSAEGERLAFSFVVNDVPSPWAAKRAEDRLGVELAQFRRGIPTGLPARATDGVRVQDQE